MGRELPVLTFFTEAGRDFLEATLFTDPAIQGGRMGGVGPLAAPGTTERVQLRRRELAGYYRCSY